MWLKPPVEKSQFQSNTTFAATTALYNMSKSYGERIRAAEVKGRPDAAQALRLERDAAWLADDGRLTAEFRAAMRDQDYARARQALIVRQEASRKRIDGMAFEVSAD